MQEVFTNIDKITNSSTLCSCECAEKFILIYSTIVGDSSVEAHLFPYRTQKLSSTAVTILVGKPAGKITHCQHSIKSQDISLGFFLSISSLENFHSLMTLRFYNFTYGMYYFFYFFIC